MPIGNLDIGGLTRDTHLELREHATRINILLPKDGSEFFTGNLRFGTAGDVGITRNAAGVLEVNTGVAGTLAWFREQGDAVVTADFSVTNSTTLVNVTGLTFNVVAGRRYAFEVDAHTTSANTGGIKLAIAGTATATWFLSEGVMFENAGVVDQTRTTTIGNVTSAHTTCLAAYSIIHGTILVNAGGTLTLQFAQNAANATPSVLLRGSTMIVHDVT